MTDSKTSRKPYKPRWPWDSYGPEWKELWLKASRQAFYTDFPTKTKMNSTLLRAQHYRKLAQERDEPGWRLLYRATTHKDKIVENRLHFLPVEEPHREFFAQAGIVAPESPTPTLPGEGQIEAESPVPEMDRWMEKLVTEGAAAPEPKEEKGE